jgi:hypothetical protein
LIRRLGSTSGPLRGRSSIRTSLSLGRKLASLARRRALRASAHRVVVASFVVT